MSSFEVAPQRSTDGSHAWLLEVSGDFDTTAVAEFDRALDEAVAHGARLVTVDLADVEFLDSSGLRSVLAASNRLAELDGHLTVAGLSGAAKRVLEVSGVIERLTAGPPAGVSRDEG
jgi:anti-anti-sigma factor